MKKRFLLVFAVLVTVYVACPTEGTPGNGPDYSHIGPYNPDLPNGPVGPFRIQATTSHPQAHIYLQTQAPHNDFIAFTVVNMNPATPTAFQVEYTIKNYFDEIIEQQYINFNSGYGSEFTLNVPMDRTEIGHFTVEARIMGGITRIIMPARGTRPTDFITYAVIPDPVASGRRMNTPVTLPVTGQETIKIGVDKSTFFGMAIVPASGEYLYDDVFEPVQWLGIDATNGSALAWNRFWQGDEVTGRTNTDRFALFQQIGSSIQSEWPPYDTHLTVNCMMGPMYVYYEMLAYHPAATRTPAGMEGLYSGALSALGEQELIPYVQGVARTHIAKARQRPHHYYQILWEPDEWWRGWMPQTNADRDRVRVYQLAYRAIHDVYREEYERTGDERWLRTAVVLGPTSSGAAVRDRVIPWHTRMLDAGLANYIDGLSIHPYNDTKASAYDSEADELAWADLHRDLMELFRTYYEQRPAVGSSWPSPAQYDPADWSQRIAPPRMYDDLFFWGTEQGLREADNGPRRNAQLLVRQGLTMLGEGYHSNHNFTFMDYNTNERYGYFYNCSPMGHPLEIYGSQWIAPKKQIATYSAFTLLMKGYESRGRIPAFANGGSNGTQLGYKFQDTWNGVSPNGPFIYAVWDWEENNTGSPAALTLDETGKITVYNVIGQDITSEIQITGNTLNLTLTEDVMYIKVEPGF